jgi:hypothetical protein
VNESEVLWRENKSRNNIIRRNVVGNLLVSFQNITPRLNCEPEMMVGLEV